MSRSWKEIFFNRDFADRIFKETSEGECYFEFDVAMDIIGRCEKANLPVLSVNGAEITDNRHYESLNWMIDLEEAPHAYDSIRRFIDQHRTLDLKWLITIGED